MLKTRLGLPANVVAFVMYLVALIGGAGMVAPLLLAGYILLFEDLNFVRRAAVKSIAIVLAVFLVNVVITVIPELLDVVEHMLNIFDESMYGDFIRGYDSFTAMLTSMLALAEKAFLILLAVMALFNKTINLKFVNKLADK